jgi:hypothetical protein
MNALQMTTTILTRQHEGNNRKVNLSLARREGTECGTNYYTIYNFKKDTLIKMKILSTYREASYKAKHYVIWSLFENSVT